MLTPSIHSCPVIQYLKHLEFTLLPFYIQGCILPSACSIADSFFGFSASETFLLNLMDEYILAFKKKSYLIYGHFIQPISLVY